MQFKPNTNFIDGNTEYHPAKTYDLPEHKAREFHAANLGTLPKNKMMPESSTSGNSDAGTGAQSSASPAAPVSTPKTVITSKPGGKQHQNRGR